MFSGVSQIQIKFEKILRKRKISAICVGNSLNYKENKIQYLKKVLNISQLREPAYQIEGKLMSDLKICKRCFYSSNHPLGITFDEKVFVLAAEFMKKKII